MVNTHGKNADEHVGSSRFRYRYFSDEFTTASANQHAIIQLNRCEEQLLNTSNTKHVFNGSGAVIMIGMMLLNRCVPWPHDYLQLMKVLDDLLYYGSLIQTTYETEHVMMEALRRTMCNDTNRKALRSIPPEHTSDVIDAVHEFVKEAMCATVSVLMNGDRRSTTPEIEAIRRTIEGIPLADYIQKCSLLRTETDLPMMTVHHPGAWMCPNTPLAVLYKRLSLILAIAYETPDQRHVETAIAQVEHLRKTHEADEILSVIINETFATCPRLRILANNDSDTLYKMAQCLALISQEGFVRMCNMYSRMTWTERGDGEIDEDGCANERARLLTRVNPYEWYADDENPDRASTELCQLMVKYENKNYTGEGNTTDWASMVPCVLAYYMSWTFFTCVYNSNERAAIGKLTLSGARAALRERAFGRILPTPMEFFAHVGKIGPMRMREAQTTRSARRLESACSFPPIANEIRNNPRMLDGLPGTRLAKKYVTSFPLTCEEVVLLLRSDSAENDAAAIGLSDGQSHWLVGARKNSTADEPTYCLYDPRNCFESANSAAWIYTKSIDAFVTLVRNHRSLRDCTNVTVTNFRLSDRWGELMTAWNEEQTAHFTQGGTPAGGPAHGRPSAPATTTTVEEEIHAPEIVFDSGPMDRDSLYTELSVDRMESE